MQVNWLMLNYPHLVSKSSRFYVKLIKGIVIQLSGVIRQARMNDMPVEDNGTDSETGRRLLNLHPVYPDENMGPIDRVDGYNAHIGHSFRLAWREFCESLARLKQGTKGKSDQSTEKVA